MKRLTSRLASAACVSLAISAMAGTIGWFADVSAATLKSSVSSAPEKTKKSKVPAVTLTASDQLIQAGGSVTLTWNSTNSKSCAASGGWSGQRAVTGNEVVSNLTQSQEFSLSCSGKKGTGAASVFVTIDGPATGPLPSSRYSIEPAEEAVVKGSTAVFAIYWSGECLLGVRWQRNGIDIPGATSPSGCISPTYTLGNVNEGDDGARFRAVIQSKSGTVITGEALLKVVSLKPKVADTGIQRSQCYRAGSHVLVDCASAEAFALNPDQDGMRIEGFGFSFVGANAIQDCVHDDVTGLTWEGKVYPPDNSSPNSRGLLVRTYTQALQYAAYVNSISLCGYTDWRIPTFVEMLSIANYGMNPYVAYWLRGYDESYWTSSSWSMGNIGAAGYPGITPTDATKLNVRLVRSDRTTATSSQPRYSVSANQLEVTDNSTGLVWKRCPEGRSWNGTYCFGALSFTHEEALAYARGSGGWRLPSITELASIIPTPENPTVASILPFDQFSSGGGYWSSTPCVRGIDADGARKSFSVRVSGDGVVRDLSCGASPRHLTYYQIRLVK